MCLREDYYKFTYELLPHTVFNYGRLLIYRLMRNEVLFIEDLKRTWSTIEMRRPELKSDPPSFSLEVIHFNDEHTGVILTIPEAVNEMEAAYIGITYDRNDNFRYFTYEVGKERAAGTLFFTSEYTADFNHYNYGFHIGRDKNQFIKEISDLLVYDLF